MRGLSARFRLKVTSSAGKVFDHGNKRLKDQAEVAAEQTGVATRPEGRQKAISLDEIYRGEQKAVTQDHPFLFKKTGHLSPMPCETLNPQVYGVSR